MNRKVIKLKAGGNVPAVDDLIDPDNVPLGLEEDDETVIPDLDDDKIKDPIVKKSDSLDDDDDDDNQEYQPVNHADFALTQLGFTNKKIDLGDGVIKNVADLTENEQLELVTDKLQEVVSFYQGRLNEIEESGGAFNNEVENVLIQTLRANEYNLTDLVKIISENDPAALAKSSTNEELVTKHLKSIYPDFDAEDIQEELENMSGTSRFDKLASKLRENLIGQKLGEGDLAKAIQGYNSTKIANQSKEFEDHKTGLSNYLNSFNDFGGVPIGNEIKQLLFADLVSESADKDSNFLSELNTPEKIVRLSFLDKFHDQIVKGTADYYFNLGKAESNKIVAQFKEKPDAIVVGSKFRKKEIGGTKKKYSIEDSPIEM
jgi:hypothetical protein